MSARAGLTTAVLVGLLATGCTSQPPDEPPPDRVTVPEPSEGSSPSTDPGALTTRPLVLAVHPRRPPIDLSEELARRVANGEVHNWRALGQPAAPLRVNQRTARLDRLPWNTVAVVVADAVSPAVRVLDVDGIDPLEDPQAYPLQVQGPPPRLPTTMTVVGDIMLGRQVGERAAAEGDPAYQLRPMQDRLGSADITIGNLESTLSDDGEPRQPGDDSFAADPRVRTGLREAGFDALDLANNHTGDFGDPALLETVALLRRGGLSTFGAGRDPRRAWQPAILERNGVTFGFLAFNAIGETPEVAPGQPGAVSISMPPRTGPLDRGELRRFLTAVRRLATQVDVVTVLPHWGTQYTERPEPIQDLVARRLAAAGADLVVGGHPHWVQGASMVDDTLVVNSLGNFVFDMDFMEQTQEGLVLETVFWGDQLMSAEFVPYRIGADYAPRVVPYAEADGVLDLFWRFSGLGSR